LPYIICTSRRIIIIFYDINILAKVTNPFSSLLNEFDEGINICSTIFTSDNWILIKAYGRNSFSTWKFSIRFYYNCQRDTRLFIHLRSMWNSISSNPYQWFVRVEFIHRLTFKRSCDSGLLGFPILLKIKHVYFTKFRFSRREPIFWTPSSCLGTLLLLTGF